MAIIIGSLALLVALMAVWLATASMKNIATQGDVLLQRIRKEQREALSEVAEKIKKLEKSDHKITEKLNGLFESES